MARFALFSSLVFGLAQAEYSPENYQNKLRAQFCSKTGNETECLKASNASFQVPEAIVCWKVRLA